MESITLQDLQFIRGTLPPLRAGWVYVSSLSMKTYKKTPLLKRWCEVRKSDDHTAEQVMEFYRDIDELEPTKRIHLSHARLVVSRRSRLTQAQLARIPGKPSVSAAFYIDFPYLRRPPSIGVVPMSPVMETRSIKAEAGTDEGAEDFPLGFIMVTPDPSEAEAWERCLLGGCKVSLPRERRRVKVQRWINRAWMRLRGNLSIDQFDESNFRQSHSLDDDNQVAENFFSILPGDTSPALKLKAYVAERPGAGGEFVIPPPLAGREDSMSSRGSLEQKSFMTADGESGDEESIEHNALTTRRVTKISSGESLGKRVGYDGFASVEDMLGEKDTEVRHTTPISETEIESVITYVEATRSLSDKTSAGAVGGDGWMMCSEAESFDCFKSVDEGSGLVRTRTWARIAGIPPQCLFHILYDNQCRKGWDHHYARFETIWADPSDPRLDVLDAVVSAPLGCANREFMEWRRRMTPPPQRDERSGKFVIYLRSWDGDTCRPVDRGNVRAEVWLSAYLIQWWRDEAGNCLGSDVMVMSQIDIKGLIPKYIVSALSNSAPRKWVKGVTTAATKELEKHGGADACMAMSDEQLDKLFGVHAE